MDRNLFIAIFAGLGAMLGWGFADFFAKKTIDKVGSIVSLVWAHVFGTSALVTIALFNTLVLKKQLFFPDNFGIWGTVLFFGALQALVYLFAYEGFGKGKLAILNPVFASYSGLAAIVSIVMFGESIKTNLLLALFIIFCGVLLVSIDLKGLLIKRLQIFGAPGLKEVGLAALMAAFWQVYWDRFLGSRDWVLYTLLMYGFMTLTAFVISKIKKVNLSVKNPGLWKFLILIGVCEVIAYLALSLGFSTTSFTSVVIVLAGAFSLPTIILARIFLKEKVGAVQTAGSLIIIAGIIILSLQ